jgi:hypothetical protein
VPTRGIGGIRYQFAMAVVLARSGSASACRLASDRWSVSRWVSGYPINARVSNTREVVLNEPSWNTLK